MTDADTILQSMIDNIEARDNSVDVRKGPFLDFVLAPVADEIAPAYAEIQTVGNMMSQLATGDAATMTSSFLDALGTNVRVSKQSGRKAVCRVLFYFQTLPASELVIPAGTSVSTTDGKQIFTTDNTVSGITRTTAVNYYRPATGRYEVPVTVTATAEGTAYNVPANRLTYLPSSVDGIDGVYNPIKAEQGRDAADSTQYLADIRNKFLGCDSSSTAGLLAKINANYGTSIQVSFVDGNSALFTRPVPGKGLDVYINQSSELSAEDLFVTGSETVFVLKSPPVLGIQQVLINGTATDNYEFIRDTTAQATGSPKAVDRVSVPDATVGDVVRVTYTWDSVTNWIQDNVLSTVSDDYFGVDSLARLATATPVWIGLKLTVGSATTGLIESVRNYLTDYVSTNTYGTLVPESIQADLLSGFPNLRAVQVLMLSRTATQSGIVKPLESSGVEAFTLPSANIAITVA